MSVTVQFNRPLFRIPMDEAIEEILQYVLYHRRQVPVVVSSLLNDHASSYNNENIRDLQTDVVELLTCNHGKKIERFRFGFTAARECAKHVFRIDFGVGVGVRRAAIVIGSSPTAPVDLYLIEFRTPIRRRRSDHDTQEFADELSASLTNGERRKIIRQLIDQGVCYRRGDHDFKEINRATKTFLFVEADRGVSSQQLQPRPDLDFLRYCVNNNDHSKATNRARSNNVQWIVLNITGDSEFVVQTTTTVSDGTKEESSNMISASFASTSTNIQSDTASIWYQFLEPIHGFDEE